MIVYHGTTMIVPEPDVMHSKNYLDFGKGFDVTTYQDLNNLSIYKKFYNVE